MADKKYTKAKALEGVKIASFAQAMAGAMSVSYLASFGATTIKVESRTKLDWMRQAGPFIGDIQNPDYSIPYLYSNSGGQYGVTLNLKAEKGKELAKRIIEWSDVVIENFAGGVMARLGLGYQDLIKIKPDIIMASASIFGATGPYSNIAGYGTTLTALSAIPHLTGFPDGPPQLPSAAFTDFITPRIISLAVVSALDYRRRTGKGQFIDVSQLEAAVPLLTPVFLEYEINGRELGRVGNKSTRMAPRGAYPCKGEDRWCTISVVDDEEWERFCKVMGHPDWARSPRFSTIFNRIKNNDELDRLIGQWTRHYSPEELMNIMQGAGIAAGVVQTGKDLANDPHLRSRDFFYEIKLPGMGDVPYTGMTPKLSRTPAETGPTPLLGEHNHYVFTELLGLSDEEFVKLDNEGAFE